jgi:hypothetical protein
VFKDNRYHENAEYVKHTSIQIAIGEIKDGSSVDGISTGERECENFLKLWFHILC